MSTTMPRTHRTPRASRADTFPRACWCGQDLEHVRSSHCPRCGRASRQGSVSVSLPAV
jgi:hypothetical protein